MAPGLGLRPNRDDKRRSWGQPKGEEMDLGLEDKVAVITGGTVGIGLAVAEGLAAEGANLVLVGRGRDRAEDAAVQVAQKFGVIATAIAADVATADGCE